VQIKRSQPAGVLSEIALLRTREVIDGGGDGVGNLLDATTLIEAYS
jgi:hypothetical protein